MAKEKLSVNEDIEIKPTDDKKKLTLQVDLPDSGELIVCKVCGHKNPKNAGMCAMCSNYLFD